MKKKFFTLFAAAAFLLGSTVPAFASVPHTPFTGAYVGDAAKSLVKGANNGLYHITNVDPNTGNPIGLLYVDNGNTANAGKLTIENPTTVSRLLGESLWCVEIATEAQGKNPSFSFLNKAYGDNLRANTTGVSSLILDGPLTDWKFSNVYGANVALETVQPLYSYINGSEAIVLVKGATPGEVKTVVAKVIDIETAANTLPIPATIITTVGGASETLLYFTLNEAAPIVLTAEDFNTKLGTEPTANGQKLVFNPDKNVGSNPFSENVLKATDVTPGATNANRYLNLQNAAGKYLRVDTSLVNATGSYFLNFKFTDAKEAGLVDQYAFRFVYFPSHDSLIINVKSALQPSKSQEALGKSKFHEYVGLNNTKHGAKEGELVSFDDVYNPAHNSLIDFTYVILQDLNNNKVVTIGELPSQTRISLGLGGCKPAVNKTSAEGLFVIKNKAGKYLQVPIYTDSIAPAAKWVTLEENVDPFQMPSFQWVVEKIRSNDPDNTSQITITNREYENVSVGTVQLWKDKETTIANVDVNGTVKTNTTKWDNYTETFIEVPEAQRLDPYLGYKYVSEDIAKLRTYTFNYLHKFDNSTYLSVKAEGDSLLYVQKDNKDGFELVPYHHSYSAANGWSVKPVSYGYTGGIKKINNKNYAAELVRSAYVLKIKEGSKLKNTNKIVVVDKEGRYAVTYGDNNAIAAGDSAVFYLKTNNTKDGVNYYALVDTASFTNPLTTQTGGLDRITVKAGVDDNNLWVKAQNHYEIRTSAFAVEPNEEPLYRRFNRAKDGIEKGGDSFYSDTDAASLNLRFHRKFNPNEFLYEDQYSQYANKGISFLGYKHVADFKLGEAELEERTTFFVDTVFVNRPATPGAEFDTPKPQYLIGVAKKVYASETSRPNECEPEIVTEGYTRARYLINATDSVYGAGKWQPVGTNKVINSDYIWDTKWERLVFVDGIYKNDTLYILNGQKYDDPIQNFSALRNDNKVTKIALNNNNHKDVVFSFRLIDAEKGVSYEEQVQDFLIESEAYNRNKTTLEIAPMNGGWVKVQNGVPVISRGDFSDAITDAEKFNVKASKAQAVANEVVNATAVKVVAGNGNITILNAAGKTVAISNILGQTIANTVITSDNATIAAPKGIVVVAIEGEDAVKAIVK